MSSFALYFLLALLAVPLWWPALRVVLAEVRLAADSRPPAESAAAPVSARPLGAAWSTPRTRLAALAAARHVSSARRWEGGFGRRSL